MSSKEKLRQKQFRRWIVLVCRQLVKVDDCKFVTAVLRDIFSTEISSLLNMTATGRGVDKTAIPEKQYEIIEQIYNKRMEYATKYESDVDDRKKSLNKNIKSALDTIKRSV